MTQRRDSVQTAWRLCMASVVVFALSAAGATLTSARAPLAAGDDKTAAPKTVRLIIDYGDGVEKHFTAMKWKSGLTVLDAMNQAARHARGIKFQHKGSGETALLTRIDDVKNNGGGRGKKNWIFWVNDKMADRGFAVSVLKPSDVVRWRFTEYKVD